MATAKLNAPNGATVSVDLGRVDSLLRYGFTEASDTDKAPAKKSASSKSSKK